MDSIQEMLPVIIPLIIIQYTLALVAIVHIVKHPTYRFGNMPMWIIIVFFIQFIGPIIYFLFGRGEEN